MNWIYILDITGVAVFALTGVILACRSRMDPFGMLVLAAITGIGGGTLRDLVLGIRPVFWVSDPVYLWVILATVFLSILGFRYIHRLTRIFLPVTDAFGLSIFTVIGAHKALQLGSPGVVAVIMGLMTGVAGGIIRDVLAHRMPMVLRREVYATASIIGGSIFVVATKLELSLYLSLFLGATATLGIRLAAIYWRLSLPVFAWVEDSPDATEPNEGFSDSGSRDRSRVKLLLRESARRDDDSPKE